MIEKSDLTKSRVKFYELEHQYWLDGKELSGITGGVIERYVIVGKYDGVPKDTLKNAGLRGSDIHTQVQMIVDGFGYHVVNPVVEKFFDEMQGTNFIASEYLVSDNEHFASKIDIVDDECNLYDIKTCAKLDTEYLSWQLSIYAYMFERQNPKLKVPNLYGCWLCDKKVRVVKIERISDDIIEGLLNACANNLEWENPLKKNNEVVDKRFIDNVKKLERVELAIAKIEEDRKAYEEQSKVLREGLLQLMLNTGHDKYESEMLKISVRQPSIREVVDTARLKDMYSEVYQDCIKQSHVKASLTIKVK